MPETVAAGRGARIRAHCASGVRSPPARERANRRQLARAHFVVGDEQSPRSGTGIQTSQAAAGAAGAVSAMLLVPTPSGFSWGLRSTSADGRRTGS
jgi:hypothetical protein